MGQPRSEVEQYAKYGAVGTARQHAGSYFSVGHFGNGRYGVERCACGIAKASVLCAPKNKGELDWQRIRCSNKNLQELADGRPIYSYLSPGREIATANKLFSSVLPALAYFDTSHNVHTYGNYVPLRINSMYDMDEPGANDTGIHFRLRRDQGVTQRFRVPGALSRKKLQTVTYGRLLNTTMHRKRRHSRHDQNWNMWTESNKLEVESMIACPASTHALKGTAQEPMAGTFRLVRRSLLPVKSRWTDELPPVSI